MSFVSTVRSYVEHSFFHQYYKLSSLSSGVSFSPFFPSKEGSVSAGKKKCRGIRERRRRKERSSGGGVPKAGADQTRAAAAAAIAFFSPG